MNRDQPGGGMDWSRLKGLILGIGYHLGDELVSWLVGSRREYLCGGVRHHFYYAFIAPFVRLGFAVWWCD